MICTNKAIWDTSLLIVCLLLFSSSFSQSFTKIDSVRVLQSPYNNIERIAASSTTLSFLLTGKRHYLYNYNYFTRQLDSIELKTLEYPIYISNEHQTKVLDVSRSYLQTSVDTKKGEMNYETKKISKQISYNAILSNEYSNYLLNTYNYYSKKGSYDTYRILDLVHHISRKINVGNQIVLSTSFNNLVAIDDHQLYMALPKSLQILVFDDRLKIADTIKIAAHTSQKEYAFLNDSIIKYNKTTPKSLSDFMQVHNIVNMEQIFNMLLYKEHYLFLVLKDPVCKSNCKRVVIYDLITKRIEKDFYEEQISNNFWLNANTRIVSDSVFIDYYRDLNFPDSLGSYVVNFYKFNLQNIDTTLVPSKIAYAEKTYLDTISKRDFVYRSKSPETFVDKNLIKMKLVELNSSIKLDTTINYKGIIFVNELVCKDCFEKLDFKDYIVVFKDVPNKEYRKLSISYYAPYFKNGIYVFNENTFIAKELYNKIYNFMQ